MKTAHQFARELLAGPDLPVFHFDPSRAGTGELDTSISDPVVEEVDPTDGLTDEEVAENKQEGCNTDSFLTICGDSSDEAGEAITIRESDRLRALEMLSSRVHSGYDFNADPDRMTLIVGAAIRGDPRELTPSEQVDQDARIAAAWEQFERAIQS